MRTFLTVIMALVCAITFAQKKPNINKAKSAMENGELSEAKAIIEQAIVHEKTKDDAKTWHYRGMIYSALDTALNEPEAMETAIASFNKSLEIDPEQKSTTQFTGSGLTNVDSSIDGYYGYYYNRALLNYNNEDFDKASVNFENAFFINPSDTNAILNAAYAATAAGNDAKAKSNYERSYEAGVRDKNVFLQLYNFAIQEENLEEALSVIRKGKEKYTNDSDFNKYEISLLIQLDKVDDAKSELEKSIANDPNNPDLIFSLGVLNDQLGDNDGAVKAYNDALKIDPDHYNSNFNLGVNIFNQSNELIKQRNDLGYKETKKYDQLTIDINNKLKDALPIWEKLYTIDKTDRTVLETLSYIYSNLKMKEKSAKIEKELDAASN